MYPVKRIYSHRSFKAWEAGPPEIDLSLFTCSAAEVLQGDFWKVTSWEELRKAISYLTLMNKREVLYFRGQGSHFNTCLPVIMRQEWKYRGNCYRLDDETRQRFYEELPLVQDELSKLWDVILTPRRVLLEQFPAAAADLLRRGG